LLLTLAERFGDEQEGHGTLVPVVLSRGELSSLVGARVETVIRVLSRWQKQGLLETSREGFLLRDIGALAAVQRSKAELD
jgi:CRP/FNR family transcriptional regulator